MGLIIITELFYPAQVSTGYIMTAIAQELANEQEVAVICGPSAYTKEFEDKETELPNIIIYRVKVWNWDKNNLILRVIRQIILSIKMGYKLFSSAKTADTIVAVTNPAPLLLLVSQICKWKKLKLVVIVHDVFPENLVAAKILSKKALVYRLLLSIFNRAYQSVNHLIVLGRDMKKLFEQKLNGSPDRITVVSNWADTVNIYPQERTASSGLKLQFAGNFGRLQGLIRLLDAINKAANEQVAVDFIGDGAMLLQMRQYVNDRINILPPFERNEQQDVLNSCDASFVSLSEGMEGLGVPSKLYNILAAGKPIIYIGAADSEIALLMDEYDIGWKFANCGQELISFLQTLNTDCRPEMIRKGINARNLAMDRFTKQAVLNSYSQIIKAV